MKSKRGSTLNPVKKRSSAIAFKHLLGPPSNLCGTNGVGSASPLTLPNICIQPDWNRRGFFKILTWVKSSIHFQCLSYAVSTADVVVRPQLRSFKMALSRLLVCHIFVLKKRRKPMRKSIILMMTYINLTLFLSFSATSLIAQTDFWEQTLPAARHRWPSG